MMSTDPANTLPPEYDDSLPKDYDPAYTADISTKMRVPDSIGVKGEQRTSAREMNGDSDQLENKARTANMNVPEKIIYAGNNESRGMRKEPELHLDIDLERQADRYIGLHTPPRHLTIEDAYASMEPEAEDDSFADKHYMLHDASRDHGLPNGYTPSPQHTSDTPMPHQEADVPRTPTRIPITAGERAQTPGGSQYMMMSQTEDMLLLRRQIDKLSRHVMRLEQENHGRNQREMFLYPVVGVYFIFKVLQFFLKK